jgi:Cu(I)/Ag(I) efflux system periplasmic protein CusF
VHKILARTVLALALLAPFGHAAATSHHRAGDLASGPAQSLSEGEVRKVDKDANKITLRHGPLANLDMPAMTMVFQVKDPAMLDKVKAGDKVKFRAEKVGGAFTIMQIDTAQ